MTSRDVPGDAPRKVTELPPGIAPAVILVEPQLAENIGMTARAMANFGLSELRLVNPKNGWPKKGVREAASGATHVLDRATIFGSVAEAIADCRYVLATTARERGQMKRVFAPEEAMGELVAREGQRTAVMFGRERVGLTNDEVSLADAIITFPVSPDFPSLNLAQAVLLVGYTWRQASGRARLPFSGELLSPPATREALVALFGSLEAALDAAGFYPPEKKEIIARNMRDMLHRMSLTEQDVRTFRGALRALTARGPDQPEADFISGGLPPPKHRPTASQNAACSSGVHCAMRASTLARPATASGVAATSDSLGFLASAMGNPPLQNESSAGPCGSVPRRNRAWSRRFAERLRGSGTRAGYRVRLSVDNLACRRSGRRIFSNLSFALGPGDALAITGRNGAGKSSLLAILSGRLRADAGRIAVAEVGEASLPECLHAVGHPSRRIEECPHGGREPPVRAAAPGCAAPGSRATRWSGSASVTPTICRWPISPRDSGGVWPWRGSSSAPGRSGSWTSPPQPSIRPRRRCSPN